MGLKAFFQRWSKAEDAAAIERAEEESRMTPYEREVDREDFEARKDDLLITRNPAGAGAEETAAEDLDS